MSEEHKLPQAASIGLVNGLLVPHQSVHRDLFPGLHVSTLHFSLSICLRPSCDSVSLICFFQSCPIHLSVILFCFFSLLVASEALWYHFPSSPMGVLSSDLLCFNCCSTVVRCACLVSYLWGKGFLLPATRAPMQSSRSSSVFFPYPLLQGSHSP